jgi:L-ascorbate metabolism protein UlaG (beta-lactamase superfamily)
MDSLTYIGHATALIHLDGSSLLTDPFLRDWLGPLHRQGPSPRPEVATAPDAVVISHLHMDHLDSRSIRRLPADTPVVIPRGAGRIVAKAGAVQIHEIGVGETISVNGFELTGMPASHDGHRRRWGVEIQPLGYRIRRGERSVYFAGDTDLFPGMSEVGPVDVALLPVWGWGPTVGPGHLDPESAAAALALIRPRIAVPIHWGTFYPAGLARLRPRPLVEPPLAFARRAREVAPDVDVRIVQPGAETSLERL